MSSSNCRFVAQILRTMAARFPDEDGDLLEELRAPNFSFDLLSDIEKEEQPGRFVSVTDSDVHKLIEGEENANTKRKTYYDLVLVIEWGRVKLRINITRVFRNCRNCPSRAATRAISAISENTSDINP